MTKKKSLKQSTSRKPNFTKVEKIGKELILALGLDPTEERFRETPKRWAKWWREFIDYEYGNLGTTFESSHTDQMVVISGMKVFSLCEHHLLPFWCNVSIGYIPNGRVLGLSKFARIAHKAAHKPQLQERLIQEIADDVKCLSGSKDVAVLGSGEHLCMISRGIKTAGTMTSSVMYGAFQKEASARAEFFSLIQRELK